LSEAPTTPPHSEAAVSEHEARQRQLAELLRQWREEGDLEEQRETFEILKRGLNENRPGQRKIFP
jgi:hypothetical protein